MAHAAPTGTITGATINPEGTQVSVSNMNLTIDNCGGTNPPLVGFRGCGGFAGVLPASSMCPTRGVGLEASLWDTAPDAFYTSPETRTFDSGARSAAVAFPVAYRVCLYSFYSQSSIGRFVAALRAEAVTPTPTTGRRAAAVKKCKKKHPKGPKRKKCIKKAKKLPA